MIQDCPKCGNEFEAISKWGDERKFCSRTCANSRVFTEETNALKSKKSKEFWSSLSKTEQQKHFSYHHSPEIIAKRVATLKKNLAVKRKTREETLPFEDLYETERRNILLRDQNHKCSECNTGEIWNGKPLKLELDHISGDRENNTRKNLRMICPNCHQQTPTYKGRNKKKYSDEEIIAELKSSSSIYAAMKKLGMNMGNNKRVKRLIEEHDLTFMDQ